METIRPLQPQDMPAAWALDQQTFHVDPKLHATARDPDGADRFVGAFDADELVAVCEFHRFGQFFRGRRVPMGGVASVAVRPEARGRGLASRMMGLLVDRMRAEGLVISALYPATPSLYRSLGWEFAGHWTRYTMPLERLRPVPRPERGRVRRARVDELEAIERVRVTLAAEHDGAIDRGQWAVPVYRRRFEDLHTFVALDDAGEIEGALVYRHQPTGGVQGFDYDLDVRELFARSAEAQSALLWILSSSSSVSRNVFMRGWLDDTQGWLLPELRPQVERQMRWMLRLLDVPGALEARGAPPGMTARVALRVHDEQVAENDGGFVLRVADGEVAVRRDDAANAVALDIGALSTLYSGHTTCATLARMGRLSGGEPAKDWAVLDAIFAGRPPAMIDDF